MMHGITLLMGKRSSCLALGFGDKLRLHLWGPFGCAGKQGWSAFAPQVWNNYWYVVWGWDAWYGNFPSSLLPTFK